MRAQPTCPQSTASWPPLLANTKKKSELKKWKKVTKKEEIRCYIEASEKGKV
jgi:hypothetical protein